VLAADEEDLKLLENMEKQLLKKRGKSQDNKIKKNRKNLKSDED
jgi:hypothetical protein